MWKYKKWEYANYDSTVLFLIYMLLNFIIYAIVDAMNVHTQ